MSDKDMSELLATLERSLGKSWLDIVEWLRSQNALDEVDRRLAAGDTAGVIRAVEEAAAKYAADIHAAYVSSGQEAASWLDDEVSDKIIRFDGTNARAVAWAERNKADLVRGLTKEQHEVTTRVIADGLRVGRNPRDMARDLRDSIGLTPYQSDAVQSYRRALELGNYGNAMSRALSDGRTDRSLAAALNNGTAIDPSRIDGMVDRYRANYVSYRAETIARTEGLRALHQGTEEMFRQAIYSGDVDADSLVREWNHAGHGRNSRPGHVQMNEQKRKIGDAFENPVTGAKLLYPGDQAADPSETVQCRCVLSTRYAA